MEYQSGFGSYFETEALQGALPKNQNSPQRPPLGLYAEQINGSAFTAPRVQNLRTWLYRIKPSVSQTAFTSLKNPQLSEITESFQTAEEQPNQFRWNPLQEHGQEKVDFLTGLHSWLGHGSPQGMAGAWVYLYSCNQSMDKQFFYNSDGELLIVPQAGALLIQTEMGPLQLEPKEIAVIPRGIKFRVELIESKAKGYLLENYGCPFVLPELGPIGANGLANPRDFQFPKAAFFEEKGDFSVVTKYRNQFWSCKVEENPLNVVAWHGNYAPYKYNLEHFNTINTVSYDHPDPSIFTVLTSPGPRTGVANIDFVIFPSRWMVGEETFRPPYYHRNIMSEFMGLIYGSYDAKPDGFAPGGASLHNCMSSHGPDKDAFINATEKKLLPEKLDPTMAFMFESFSSWKVTQRALQGKELQKDYNSCWQGLPQYFDQKDGK